MNNNQFRITIETEGGDNVTTRCGEDFFSTLVWAVEVGAPCSVTTAFFGFAAALLEQCEFCGDDGDFVEEMLHKCNVPVIVKKQYAGLFDAETCD